MDLSDYDNHVLPSGATDAWRTWLMTGIRRPPVDRRRVRGAHKGLKRMLVEGMSISSESPYSWKEFSDALVRQSVGDAVRSLPLRDAQVVKLAYFGGMSNDQIAGRLGISIASVERRLRGAIGYISRHVEHGKSAGRRALGAIGVWLSCRWMGDATHHVMQAGAVATVAVMIATHPAVSPVPNVTGPERAHVVATTVPRVPVRSVVASGSDTASAPSVAPVLAGGVPQLTLPVAIGIVPPKVSPVGLPVKPPRQLPLRA